MKWTAGFLFIFGVAMIINAAEGLWAFNRQPAGAVLIALDVVIGLGCWVASYLIWRRASAEEALAGYQAALARKQYEEERAARWPPDPPG